MDRIPLHHVVASKELFHWVPDIKKKTLKKFPILHIKTVLLPGTCLMALLV